MQLMVVRNSMSAMAMLKSSVAVLRKELFWSLVLCPSGHLYCMHMHFAVRQQLLQGWVSVHDLYNWLGQQLHSAAGVLLEEANAADM